MEKTRRLPVYQTSPTGAGAESMHHAELQSTDHSGKGLNMRRTAILVCGMHRCGTSALTRVLNIVGAALPLNLYPPDFFNERGHWEPRDAPSLHNEMLAAMGTKVNALGEGDEAWLQSEDRKPFKDRLKNLIANEYRDHPLIVVKDPRISLVLPLWIEILKEINFEYRIIVCFRNPLEVAQSLARRQTSYRPNDVWHIDRGGLLWLRYVTAAERYSRRSSRAFCDYSDLISDWRPTIRRLGKQLDIEWPCWTSGAENDVKDFLSPELRHHVATASLSSLGRAWEEWIDPIYRALQQAVPSANPDEAVFDRIRSTSRAAISCGSR
jgi:hypothetical protein